MAKTVRLSDIDEEFAGWWVAEWPYSIAKSLRAILLFEGILILLGVPSPSTLPLAFLVHSNPDGALNGWSGVVPIVVAFVLPLLVFYLSDVLLQHVAFNADSEPSTREGARSATGMLAATFFALVFLPCLYLPLNALTWDFFHAAWTNGALWVCRVAILVPFLFYWYNRNNQNAFGPISTRWRNLKIDSIDVDGAMFVDMRKWHHQPELTAKVVNGIPSNIIVFKSVELLADTEGSGELGSAEKRYLWKPGDALQFDFSRKSYYIFNTNSLKGTSITREIVDSSGIFRLGYTIDSAAEVERKHIKQLECTFDVLDALHRRLFSGETIDLDNVLKEFLDGRLRSAKKRYPLLEDLNATVLTAFETELADAMQQDIDSDARCNPSLSISFPPVNLRTALRSMERENKAIAATVSEIATELLNPIENIFTTPSLLSEASLSMIQLANLRIRCTITAFGFERLYAPVNKFNMKRADAAPVDPQILRDQLHELRKLLISRPGPLDARCWQLLESVLGQGTDLTSRMPNAADTSVFDQQENR